MFDYTSEINHLKQMIELLAEAIMNDPNVDEVTKERAERVFNQV